MTDVKLTITGEKEAIDLLKEDDHDFTHLISIRSVIDYETITGFEQFDEDHAIMLNFDDISCDNPFLRAQGYIPPEEEDAGKIIDFARKVANTCKDPVHLLAHCAAGISRSTAAAYIFLCVVHGPGTELVNLVQVFDARPIAQPNQLLIEKADWLLRPSHSGEVKEVFEKMKTRRRAMGTYGSGHES